jgi:hypothetical protein
MKVQVIIPDQFKGVLENEAAAQGVTTAMWVRLAALAALRPLADQAEKQELAKAPKEKELSERQKVNAFRDRVEARFGKGKMIGKDWLAPYAYTVYCEVRKAIRRPDSDAAPFKGNESDDDLRHIISYWKELDGDYAQAKRMYGERILSVAKVMRLDAKAMMATFDHLWDEIEPEDHEGW